MKAQKYQKALFIFRRDLRLDDNIGFQAVCKTAHKVIPCFIFDPVQITKKNRFKSNNALQFMLEALDDLQKQLKRRGGRLYLLFGAPHSVVEQLIKCEHVDAVVFNRDYTPYSRQRDVLIKKVCTKHTVDCQTYTDALLHEPGTVVKSDGTPYTIFTAFFKKALCSPIAAPCRYAKSNFLDRPVRGSQPATLFSKILSTSNKDLAAHGGREGAVSILERIHDFKNYDREHDFPALAKTTGLSPHLKFGTCSIREVWYAVKKQLGPSHPLLRQLYWREFFVHLAFHFPEVFGAPFHRAYQHLVWSQDNKKFKAWCEGKTGFPIVDAGMRQLNTTGFMHNRVRMITASFLVKDLHIDWRKGERYFATRLVDYDPAVNNGNWQWVASTGADRQPYFRIFNPWVQQKKFDHDCRYIKTWVPELASLAPRDIHSWFKVWKLHAATKYPRPIANHASESSLAKKYYAAAICKARKLGVH